MAVCSCGGGVAHRVSIPVLDLSLPVEELVPILHAAYSIRDPQSTGVVYITNHGVPSSLLDASFESTSAFFKQPLHEKLRAQ